MIARKNYSSKINFFLRLRVKKKTARMYLHSEKKIFICFWVPIILSSVFDTWTWYKFFHLGHLKRQNTSKEITITLSIQLLTLWMIVVNNRLQIYFSQNVGTYGQFSFLLGAEEKNLFLKNSFFSRSKKIYFLERFKMSSHQTEEEKNLSK